MPIATRLSKAGKLRRSDMLVESASYRNIQPLQGGLVVRGRVLFYSHATLAGLASAQRRQRPGTDAHDSRLIVPIPRLKPYAASDSRSGL